jgi:hypothetical protein
MSAPLEVPAAMFGVSPGAGTNPNLIARDGAKVDIKPAAGLPF